jgi:hypothetical protein
MVPSRQPYSHSLVNVKMYSNGLRVGLQIASAVAAALFVTVTSGAQGSRHEGPSSPPPNAFQVVSVRTIDTLDDLGLDFLEEMRQYHPDWFRKGIRVYLLVRAGGSRATRYLALRDDTIVPGSYVRVQSSWNDAMQEMTPQPSEVAEVYAVDRLELVRQGDSPS